MRTEVHKVRMTVDSLHILELVAEDNELAAGVRFGATAIHGMLQKAAKRAAELNDPELNYAMLYLGLYDVPDVNAALEEMKKLIDKKKEGAE